MATRIQTGARGGTKYTEQREEQHAASQSDGCSRCVGRAGKQKPIVTEQKRCCEDNRCEFYQTRVNGVLGVTLGLRPREELDPEVDKRNRFKTDVAEC